MNKKWIILHKMHILMKEDFPTAILVTLNALFPNLRVN